LDVSRENFPKLERVGFYRIQGHPIRFYSSSHPGAFKTVPDSPLRVATLGRTFLDMLRQPKLCGGIRHAVDVYREYAESYLKLIVEEVDRNGTAIEKVRAGYLLEEACGLEHEKIDGWRQFVQRGGSRKLDPNEAYGSEYSEKWCLSINI
jgi:predicted transcriptional regulator of viral defense system